MPRFFLHIRTADEYITDPEGIDRPDLAKARADAICGLRSLVSADVLTGCLHLGHSIEIHDAAGLHLSTVRIDDAITRTPAPLRSAAVLRLV